MIYVLCHHIRYTTTVEIHPCNLIISHVFILGPLVTAIKNGELILLDELSLAEVLCLFVMRQNTWKEAEAPEQSRHFCLD